MFYSYNDNGIIISPMNNESTVEVVNKNLLISALILSGQKKVLI